MSIAERELAGSNHLQQTSGTRRRLRFSWLFEQMCRGSTWSVVGVLVVLIAGIVIKAWGWVDYGFLTNFDSTHPEQAGLLAGLWGSFWLMLLTIMMSVPIGVGAAVYLEEYSRDNWLTRMIQLNLANLAGVPSIVYGILGLTAFVRFFGAFDQAKELAIPLGIATMRVPLPLDRTVLAASLTLTLLILPIVIVASQEALRSVPSSIRNASVALGATQWQTIRHQVLPAALPGILTGIILSISRAVGETAPLLMIGAFVFLRTTPGGIESPVDLLTDPQGIVDAPFSVFTAIPIQIWNWVSEAKREFQNVAAAGILVLLFVLLLINSMAIMLRNRFQSKMNW